MILWASTVLHRTGYGSAARNYLRAFDRIGLPASLVELWEPSGMKLGEADRQWYERFRDRDPGRQAVCVLHHPPAFLRGVDLLQEFRESLPGMGCYVAYTTFETDRIPSAWAEPLAAMDEVWVPSRFNFETFSRSGIPASKIRVVPHCVDAERFGAAERRPDAEGRFRFLSMFRWLERKGWNVLLRAYCREFAPSEKVSLTLHVDPGAEPNLRARIAGWMREEFGKSLDDLPPVFLETRKLEDEELPGLYASHDAFILPSRGEGWGMPLMEAMASGLPTAGTRWGGALDFMNEGNSYLIDVEGVVPVAGSALSENTDCAGHFWAEPSLESAQAALRRMFEEREEGLGKGLLAKEQIREQFGLEAVGRRIARHAEELHDQVCRPMFR